MQTLENRTCVFAGATGGDGVAAVEALLKGGMNVVMMTHQASQAQSLCDRMNHMNYTGKCVAFGVTSKGPAENQTETYQQIEQEFGSVDVVISNTGNWGKENTPETVSSRELTDNISHLTENAFDMVITALPFLKKSKAPRVILMTTVEGRCGGMQESFTNAVAKGCVHSLMMNLASHFAQYNICVNCISKGAIPRIEGVEAGFADPYKILPRVPLKRMGTMQDLAESICFLASEESGYITGTTISVSGGLEMY